MEEDFGKILYEFLRENEMTQSYFAQRVGVKQTARLLANIPFTIGFINPPPYAKVSEFPVLPP